MEGQAHQARSTAQAPQVLAGAPRAGVAVSGYPDCLLLASCEARAQKQPGRGPTTNRASPPPCPGPAPPPSPADDEVDSLVKEIEEEKAAAQPQRPAQQQ